MIFLAVSVQVILPIAIAVQLQDDLDEKYCRSTEKALAEREQLGQLVACLLRFYFGVVSVVNFLGKVRGNAFSLLDDIFFD